MVADGNNRYEFRACEETELIAHSLQCLILHLHRRYVGINNVWMSS